MTLRPAARRAASSISCTRNVIKYNYWRTTTPERDWGGGEPFDGEDVDWSSKYGGVMSSCVQVSRRFFWLANAPYPKYLGGQAWLAMGGEVVFMPLPPSPHPPVVYLVWESLNEICTWP
jgi:hypothetical protein